MIAKRCFPRAVRVTDRFHVQRLATDALQEMRIKLRWEALDLESDALEQAKSTETEYVAEVLPNGDTLKQLLARSRYSLYKNPNTWGGRPVTDNQKERAQLVFEHFPELKKAYDLAQELSNIFTNTTEKIYELTRLAKWHEKVRLPVLSHSTPWPGQSKIIIRLSSIILITEVPMLRLNHLMQR